LPEVIVLNFLALRTQEWSPVKSSFGKMTSTQGRFLAYASVQNPDSSSERRAPIAPPFKSADWLDLSSVAPPATSMFSVGQNAFSLFNRETGGAPFQSGSAKNTTSGNIHSPELRKVLPADPFAVALPKELQTVLNDIEALCGTNLSNLQFRTDHAKGNKGVIQVSFTSQNHGEAPKYFVMNAMLTAAYTDPLSPFYSPMRMMVELTEFPHAVTFPNPLISSSQQSQEKQISNHPLRKFWIHSCWVSDELAQTQAYQNLPDDRQKLANPFNTQIMGYWGKTPFVFDSEDLSPHASSYPSRHMQNCVLATFLLLQNTLSTRLNEENQTDNAAILQSFPLFFVSDPDRTRDLQD
jgi:hypothetical protein